MLFFVCGGLVNLVLDNLNWSLQRVSTADILSISLLSEQKKNLKKPSYFTQTKGLYLKSDQSISSTQLIKANYPVISPRQCSIAVFVESYPLCCV